MIITIHGTHGSGKSTAVRKVIDHFPSKEVIMRYPRRRPFGYVLSHPDRSVPLIIPGHYDTPCGGCDSIPVVDDTYHFIGQEAEKGNDVLFEGILAQHSTGNLLSLAPWKPIVLVLKISDQEATEAVVDRRLARGNIKPFNPENVIKENAGIKRRIPKLKDAGFDVRWVSREEAVTTCLELLRVGVCLANQAPS